MIQSLIGVMPEIWGAALENALGGDCMYALILQELRKLGMKNEYMVLFWSN